MPKNIRVAGTDVEVPSKLARDEGLFHRNKGLALKKAKQDYLSGDRNMPEISLAYSIPHNVLVRYVYHGAKGCAPWMSQRASYEKELIAERAKYIKDLVAKEVHQMEKANHLGWDMIAVTFEEMHASGRALNTKQLDVVISIIERIDKIKRLDAKEPTDIIGTKKYEVTPEDVRNAFRELMELDELTEGSDVGKSPITTH